MRKRRPTMADLLQALFYAGPDTWIDGRELAQHGGCYAWRSRLSDLRKRGMVIENRQRRTRSRSGEYVVSEYRWRTNKQIVGNRVPEKETERNRSGSVGLPRATDSSGAVQRRELLF